MEASFFRRPLRLSDKTCHTANSPAVIPYCGKKLLWFSVAECRRIMWKSCRFSLTRKASMKHDNIMYFFQVGYVIKDRSFWCILADRSCMCVEAFFFESWSKEYSKNCRFYACTRVEEKKSPSRPPSRPNSFPPPPSPLTKKGTRKRRVPALCEKKKIVKKNGCRPIRHCTKIAFLSTSGAAPT